MHHIEQTYTEEILARLQQAGYAVAHSVLNAADYGVPQRRRRAFFVANKSGVRFQFPKPTHLKSGDYPKLFDFPCHIGVWDAIGELPSLRHGEGEEACGYAYAPFSDFQQLMRNGGEVVSNDWC